MPIKTRPGWKQAPTGLRLLTERPLVSSADIGAGVVDGSGLAAHTLDRTACSVFVLRASFYIAVVSNI